MSAGEWGKQATRPNAAYFNWLFGMRPDTFITVVIAYARQVIFQMAEVAIPRELFRAILEGIQRLRLLTPLPV